MFCAVGGPAEEESKGEGAAAEVCVSKTCANIMDGTRGGLSRYSGDMREKETHRKPERDAMSITAATANM